MGWSSRFKRPSKWMASLLKWSIFPTLYILFLSPFETGIVQENSGESQRCSRKQCYGFCRPSHIFAQFRHQQKLQLPIRLHLIWHIAKLFPSNQPHLHLSNEKTFITFHYTGCLIGIPMVGYSKPYNKGQYITPYTTKKQPAVFFIAHLTSNPQTLKLQNLPAKWKAKFDSLHLVAVFHVVILKVVLTFCPQQSTLEVSLEIKKINPEIEIYYTPWN